ncbi:MAG: hypothetical protein HON70_39180, partial [Lentisphaerae bacterium]|nr:hypothetical protein [Lentisphaerota bacterium]
MNTPRSRPHPQVDDLSLEEKIGQLVMARYPDHDVIADALRQGQAGSFYFGMRGKSAEDVATILNGLQEEARFPAIVAFGFACTDCGSGLVAGNCMRLGAARSPELAYRLAYLETSEQRAYGFH